jgi:small subunit ribosomal protein S21
MPLMAESPCKYLRPCYSTSPCIETLDDGDICAPGRRARPRKGAGCQVQVLVRDNNVDQALKALKKKMQREGIFREMKLRRHYEKPSERRAREAAEAVRRARKLERKRLEREGF